MPYDPATRVLSLSFTRDPEEHADVMLDAARRMVTETDPGLAWGRFIGFAIGLGATVGIVMEIHRRFVLPLILGPADIAPLGVVVVQLLPLVLVAVALYAWLYLRAGGLGWAIGGAVLVLVAVGLLSYLGATQTNRHKEWVVRMQESQAALGDRFTEDPTAAARFGVYTAVTWLLAIAGFVVLTLTVGWVWSWLAIVGGVVVMMLMLARMLFVPRS